MRRFRLSQYRWWVACGALFGLAAAGGVWWAADLQARGREAQQHLVAARAALAEPSADATETRSATASSLSKACVEANAADALLRDVNGQMQVVSPLLDAMSGLPAVGERARDQTAALHVGSELAAAGSALCAGVQPITTMLLGEQPNEAGPSTAHATLQAMLRARPRLGEAVAHLEQTRAALESSGDLKVDDGSRAAVSALRERLPDAIQSLRDASTVLDLLGAQGDRRYLLVSQNPDELRASGGYIGSAGVIELSDGTVRLGEYGSSRVYDPPLDERVPTPSEFTHYLGGYWGLAGANWWPSFPDDARQLAYFYGLARSGQHVDGVVALDQYGLQRLLEVVGPVDVPEYGERVSADDLQAKFDLYVHTGEGNDESGRKQFTAVLSAAVLNQVLAAPRSKLPDLVRATRRVLDEQHLLAVVWDAPGADLLARKRWDGGLLPATGDSLMVVDTDVAASKQGQEIRRDVDYSVNLADPSGPRGRALVTYTNHSSPEQRPNVFYVRDYRTFLRVYAPAGARLMSNQGFVDGATTVQECGRAVFAGEVVVPQGQTVKVQLDYALPTSAADASKYELLVQQQPGVPPGQLAVRVTAADGREIAVQHENAPGRHHLLRLGNSTALEELPLTASRTVDCGIDPVNAVPLARPALLEIPRAKVSAPVVEVGVDNAGAMETPPTPDVVGWYRTSARSGQPGNSVFTGHVDWGTNTAVFWGLRDLAVNDSIIVRGEDGADYRYSVQLNRSFARDDPAALALVGAANGSSLTLITCDGVYDRVAHDYSERRIVKAILDR